MIIWSGLSRILPSVPIHPQYNKGAVSMTTSDLSDRRRVAHSLLDQAAELNTDNRSQFLKRLASEVLGFTPETQVIVTDRPELPTTATVIGSLTNEFGPDYLAVLLDLSTVSNPGRNRDYVTLAQVQAANDVALRYAGEERYPLLAFILPDNSGVQFVTGNPVPNNRYRLQDVTRVTAYWNAGNRTAVDCLENVGNAIVNGVPPQQAFKSGFDVQSVTSEFFKDYKEAYDRAVNQLALTLEHTDAEQFTQTLFNRLLFVQFVSKKGWLSFHGSREYLNALWRAYQADSEQTNFYTGRLDALFFAGLNNPRAMSLMYDDPVMYSTIGSVPFLNGGLFERTELDAQAYNGSFTVPDEVIEPVLTHLFNHYNFTVMEATPLDTEVAVDPEMLGKLFEETVNERHSNGAYYTPRPVVAFMCREAIKGYLAGKEIAGLNDARIADLVDNQNPGAITPQQALEVANAVAGMKTVDPACGSGAFLLGMLQEILALNDSLFKASHTDVSLYRQKLDIISNNIYGADKDGLAINTAMLRLWLSLAVDYEGEGPPNPLPNLDLKLVEGDSIAGPDPQQLDFTLQSIVNSGLREDIAAYTTAQGQRKATLKKKVDATKQQLRKQMRDAAPEGVVEWRIDFADVILNSGFDVVIANPPYGITVKDRRSTAIGHADSYTNFMGLAGDLAPGGIMAYITPTSWETGERFKKFRQYLFSKVALQSVVNLPYNVFEKPYVDTAITIAAVGKPTPSEFRLATLDKRDELDLTKITGYLTSVNWSAVSGDASLRVPLLDWPADLFGRAGANATPLGEITSSKRGIAEYNFDIVESPIDKALPFFDGQVQRYEVSASSEHRFVVVSEREMAFHRGARILTRRLVNRANRLSFARTDETFVVKEAILPLVPKFDDMHKVAVLLAILNSSLMSFLYLSRSTAAVKDDFRQVTLSGLRELPIIFPDSEEIAELAQLVESREKQNGDDVADLEQRIDTIVYRTYGVTDAEQEAIAEWLARAG